MKIEKGIEMPVKATGRGSGNDQTAWALFEAMDVGDSVLVDGKTTSSQGCPSYNSATQYGRRYGKRFSGRKEGEDKVRIWRVE